MNKHERIEQEKILSPRNWEEKRAMEAKTITRFQLALAFILLILAITY
ncbi:hypothetical protein [Vibrio porteresiae]|uniref:Uncharacterized protein n=1 Tax=Vibrio porteresiae DSM 19223 TaxID=1123496 RepID=A0ABZ0Q935_9VIBR|nr:hypothetical protein [Vibrio porteresiae]WPC72958.1 hypothetical protein R8Z52_12570 [Vibrio porteresiae DSM 19223]